MSAHRRRHILVATVLLCTVALLTVLVGLPASAGDAPTNLFLPQTGSQPVSVPGSSTIVSIDPWIEAVPDVLLLRVAPGVTLVPGPDAVAAARTADHAALSDALRHHGVVDIQPLMPAADVGIASAHTRGVVARTYRLALAHGTDPQQTRQALSALPAVELVEPDYIARAALVPNDPQYPQQWALPKIGAPAAWDQTTGSDAVVIALIDSGIDTTHPDLAGRLWVNPGETAGNGIDDDGNGYVDDRHGWNFVTNSHNPADSYGHGTQVAGVAAAVGNNGIGIAGLCWQCKLMIVTAMQSNGIANYSDVAAAVAYASSNGARVINLSLGGYADSALLRDAIREAAVTAVIVAGAGNDDSAAPFYPAAYPEVLAVAATMPDDAKAVFSNYGAWVDLAAPGDAIRTTALGGGYATESGTSLSAPYVAAAAALVASRHPTWSPDLIAWHLRNTAASIAGPNPTYLGQLGQGRLAAGQALTVNPQPAAELAGYTVDGQSGQDPAPGQSFAFVVTVRNLWLPGRNLSGVLSTTSTHAIVTAANASFGDIDSGKTGSNTGSPFQVALKSSAPYAAHIPLRLTLSGDSGYSLTLDFSLRVRSAVETLGNTQYTANTTWTSDKTYVLNGTVIVAQGVTLTIQPGTHIQVAPDKFLRVDGTLIARGTPEQPIVFTAKDGRWPGLRFTATAVDAAFDADGAYRAGSIVQHVHINDAATGLALNGRAPYIADNTFQRRTIAVNTGGDQLIRIERNTVEDGSLIVGGGATVLQNTLFTRSEAPDCSIGLRGGSPLIMQNTLDGCVIEHSVMYPVVISNTVKSGHIHLVSTQSNGGAAPRPAFLPRTRFTSISTGDAHTCAITEHGRVKCWGFNEMGQLGDGTTTERSFPVEVVGLDNSVVTVITGLNHTCALTSSGGVKCWGMGHNAALGDGTWDNRRNPVDVLGLTSGVRQIAAGGNHNCALTNDGRVMCWGTNDWGQLGDGTTEWRTAPVEVVGLSNDVQAITAGYIHTCALTTNGDVKCWGGNQFGQLGNGTFDASLIPVDVSGLEAGVKAIDTGGIGYTGHTCALNSTGGVVCWGNNERGQLGDGSSSHRATPVSVIGLAAGVIDISVGALHTCAVVTNAGIRCWGANHVGQVGDGTTTDRFVPADVAGHSTVTLSLSAGVQHTCALNAAGIAQCWGDNGHNRLGIDGPTDYQSTPTDVTDGYGHIQGNVVYNGYGISSAGVDVRVTHNSISENRGAGLELSCNGCIVMSNTIGYNDGPGIRLSALITGAKTVMRYNNLFANGDYDLFLYPANPGTQNFTLNATDNYWGVSANQIAGRIRDCTFDDNGCGTAGSTLAKVNFTPALAAPDQTAPAFVTAVTMSPNPVGLQTGTLTVDFSRPMRTDIIPSAHFHDARRGTTQKMLDEPHTMARDVTGRLWFANKSSADGVHMYDGNRFTHYTTANSGLGNDFVRAIAAAPNGDVWFAHYNVGEARAWLSQLRGASWVTYTLDLPGIGWAHDIAAMTVDTQGRLWAGSLGENVYQYDGREWRSYSKADGLIGDLHDSVVVDLHGHVWFGSNQGLSVYDGSGWRTYTKANGLPHNVIGGLFADSQGRVWVGFGWYNDPDRRFVGSFDGSTWTFYGSRESGGHLSGCDVGAFAEAPDGSIWMRHCSQVLVFNDGDWSQLSVYIDEGHPDMMIDPRGNLWHNRVSGFSGLHVYWIGLDHAFSNVTWLSPTRLQASYDFTAAVLRGNYIVKVSGAVGSDDMPAFSTPATFTVDYAGAVSNLPPLPVANAQATTDGSLNSLAASWLPAADAAVAAADPILYRYAIGTAPRARDTVGWTYQTATSFTRTDLQLRRGQSYYVTVQARGSNGLWSADSVSNAIVAGTPTAPATPTPLPGATTTPVSGPTATPVSGPTATPVSGPTATPIPGATATPGPDATRVLHLPTLGR